MRVPNVDSMVKVRVRYSQGPRMIPPQPDHSIYVGKILSPYKWLNDRQFCMTGDNDWPIRVIHMDMVEDIELVSGSFKNIDTGVKVYEVAGSKGNKYTVTRNSKGWTCTCSGFQFRKQCKHISELSTVK